MKRPNATVIFCSPSAVGVILLVVFAIVSLVIANISFLQGSGLLHNFLYGKDTSYAIIQTSNDTFSLINETILGNETLNKFMFFGMWMIIGLIVYALITSVGKSVAEATDELETLNYVHARKKSIEQDLFLRIGFRTTGVVAFTFVSWVILKFIFPYAILATRVWLGDFTKPISWLQALLGFIVFALSLHLLIIMARLALLRPRIIGGWGRFE